MTNHYHWLSIFHRICRHMPYVRPSQAWGEHHQIGLTYLGSQKCIASIRQKQEIAVVANVASAATVVYCE